MAWPLSSDLSAFSYVLNFAQLATYLNKIQNRAKWGSVTANAIEKNALRFATQILVVYSEYMNFYFIFCTFASVFCTLLLLFGGKQEAAAA